MKNLFKKYSFWTALAGTVGLLFVSLNKIFGWTISISAIEELIMAICGILVVLGIVNKPTSKTKNKDENNKQEKTIIQEIDLTNQNENDNKN